MANKDYYQILGVDRNATDDQIKSAYKKAALKWHPDRHANESEDKKKEAEEKFKEIAEAYGVLSDPKKKQMYDTYGTVDGDMGGGFSGGGFHGGFHFGGMDMDPEDIFNIFRGRGGRSGRSERHEPGATINIQVGVSLEEVYNGGTKNVDYDIETRCGHCGGQGGHGIKTCPYCHGSGMITETKSNGWSTIQTSRPCPHCQGKGTIVEEVCKECGGTGVKKQHKNVNVTIPRGVENGGQIKVDNAGYESRDPKGVNGDLIVTFVYQFDQTRYKIAGNNLYELVDIPYYDVILGTEKEITLPNKEKIKVKIPKCSKDSQQITVHGKGINYGNYVLVINVSYPAAITSKEEKLLEDIKKIHK